MDELFEVVLVNATMASLMAGGVAVLAKWPPVMRRPSISYFLWLLVLIKLVTPPLLEIPVMGASAQNQREEHKELAQVTQPTLAHASPGVLNVDLTTVNAPNYFAWQPWLIGLSVSGTLLLLGSAGIQAVQLNRALRNGESTDPRILRVASTTARTLGLTNPPAVSVVSSRVPPLLWFWRRTPLVVVPRSLTDTLTDEQLRSILAHEYVHYVRRDHWLAAVSYVVVSMVWWNPIAWLAWRELRSLQEVLCDSHVLKLYPESRSAYARTLLKTLDFLQGEPAPLVSLATSFGSKSFIRRRFDMIASQQVSSQLTRGGVLALCCGLAVLVCTPAWSEEDTMDLKKCPEKVQKTIQAEAHGGQILEVEQEKSESGVAYEAEVKIADHIYEILVTEEGKLISKELDDEEEVSEAEESETEESEEADNEEEDEQEEAVTMKELPKAVKATLKREAKGGEIEEIERELEDGRVVYSAEVEYDTEEGELVYEVEIAEDGLLLSKALEVDEEHDGQHDSDDEDNEEHEHHREE